MTSSVFKTVTLNTEQQLDSTAAPCILLHGAMDSYTVCGTSPDNSVLLNYFLTLIMFIKVGRRILWDREGIMSFN